MARIVWKPVLGSLAFGALLGGCATTVEMGPGYYHYDTRAAGADAPAVVYQAPAPRAVYQEPTAVYHEPAVIYHEPAVVYREPDVTYGNRAFDSREPVVTYRTVPYGNPWYGAPYRDHGQ